MRVFNSPKEFVRQGGTAVTVGSFDGVHSGHRELLSRVKERAAGIGGESVVVTFSPHPRQVLARGGELRLLNTLSEKIILLDELGIDNLVVIKFDESFASLTSGEFVENILARQLGMRSFVVGFDHRLGHGQDGDSTSVAEMGRRLGFSTEEVECQSVDGGKVSSTAVRKLIEAGDMSAAGALLGAGYIVIAGIGENGRLSLPDKVKLMPPAGIYGVGVTDLYSGEKYRDLLSVGEDGLRLTNGHGLPSGREVLLRFD